MSPQHSDTPPRELQLTAHRATGASVWDRRGWNGANDRTTRWLLGAGGGALAAEGLRRRGPTGSLFAGLGATLIWWAISGHGQPSPVRQWLHGVLERRRPADPVVEASAESFPASDPPSFTSTVGTGTRPKNR
jgi:hypothetical protein